MSDNESESAYEGIKDYSKLAEKEQNTNDSEHRLRLSIDVHALKEHDFRGNIYARYQSIVDLNIKQFKSAPPIAITKPKVEEKFPNSFRSYTFDCASVELKDRLQQTIEIELWHQDRLKKDILIGVCKYNLQGLMKGEVKKTSQSYAKVADQFLPVDEVDEDRKPIRKIAELRVIFYLEDLGPKEQLIRRERQLGIKDTNEVRDFNEDADNAEQDNNNRMPALIMPEKTDVFGDLEYKIIWELETWKKAEESKFKIILKQKEMEFLSNLSEEWKKKEYEKEKVFKKTESSITLISKKMKEKATELQKREQKIVLLEEELKSRINETSRQISNKEDEINQLKRKLKDERGNGEKDKMAITLQHEQLKEEYNNMKKEFEKFKREQENSPINIVKNELKDKLLEIKELKKELSKSNEIRDQYKVYYEKIRAELLKNKKQYEMLKEENQFKNNAEIEALKGEVEHLKQLQNESAGNVNLAGISNPFRRNGLESAGLQQNQSYAYGNNNNGDNNINYEEYNWDKTTMGELENLIYQRDYLLSQGGYFDNDPLIVQLNNQIKAKQA